MSNVIPTKGNLIASKRSLALAKMGYELMDRKRNILIREIMSQIERAGELQGRIDTTFRDAYQALQDANITLGIPGDIAQTIPVDNSIALKFRSVMGVELPIVQASREPPALTYGFVFTNSALDSATMHFDRVKKLAAELAELETAIYRLAYAIKKTQKRANALQNIIIINLNRDIKFISEALEEKEREEFVRLKVIKAQKG